MYKIRDKFVEKGFDESDYQRFYRCHQAEYIRIRMRAVHSYAAHLDFTLAAQSSGVCASSLRKYVNMYLVGGFAGLCQADTRHQPCFLSPAQALAFKAVLLNSTPSEQGLSGNLWTGSLMCTYLKKTYGVVYQSGIYDLLERLNLSHQKAHADYGNADKEAQKAYIETLQNTLLQADAKTAILQFDEFSVCEKPTSYYGWAEKNTRPQVKTNEKKTTN
jgi:transposase